MACKSVARTARQDAQCRIRVNQRASHLVHGSVATYGYYDVSMLLLGFCCQLGACPALSVNFISYSKSSLSKVESINLGMPALLTVPEIGFIMKTIFFFILSQEFGENVVQK